MQDIFYAADILIRVLLYRTAYTNLVAD